MKKTYQRPAITEMELNMSQQILTGSSSGIAVDDSASLDNENDFQSQHKHSGWDSEMWFEN